MNHTELEPEQDMTIASYDATAEHFSGTIARLTNYNASYDFLCERLNDGDRVLDLACGPAQISAYLSARKRLAITGVDLSEGMLAIARRTIPDGLFKRQSIIDYTDELTYRAVIIGFGLPYLNGEQTALCLRSAAARLEQTNPAGAFLYVSFMEGCGSRREKTSFGGDNDFRIYYHEKKRLVRLLDENGLQLVKEYQLDYTESNGSITRDIVLIGQRTTSF